MHARAAARATRSVSDVNVSLRATFAPALLSGMQRRVSPGGGRRSEAKARTGGNGGTRTARVIPPRSQRCGERLAYTLRCASSSTAEQRTLNPQVSGSNPEGRTRNHQVRGRLPFELGVSKSRDRASDPDTPLDAPNGYP